MKPLFITFEGGEGSGKTTQSKRLVEYLNSHGKDAVWTREIGGTPLAEKIRELIFSSEMDTVTEMLLVMAARSEHVKHVIKPALAARKIVVCDRFIDSSLCYQGAELGFDKVLKLHNEVFENLMPDITFFIDVPVEDGLRRAGARGGNNRFEARPIAMHQKLRENFNKLVALFPNRIIKIDGLKSQDEIAEEVLKHVR